MVHRVKSGNLQTDPGKLRVKLEIEDPLHEEHGPLDKRPKVSAPFDQQWSTGSSSRLPHPAHYNPLDEPSPLGLRLRKSPSLLDLIQMRLSQGNSATSGVTNNENLDIGKKNFKNSNVVTSVDKLKASNFPASLLRIGTWECVSRYEGDLVAKCYFAKHKLVWEVLDGGLKSKIEIQWSDITAIKANCPENGPGTLDIVLARQPLFFRETNPQPRKHTLWQATSDFTDGQASRQRRHFLQCPQGLLNKHFEKLIQCDPRLNLLSQQPDIPLESPYFETRVSVFEDPDESKGNNFDQLKNEYVSTFSGFHDAASPCAVQSSSSLTESCDQVNRAAEAVSRGTSPSSDNRSIGAEELTGTGYTSSAHSDQFKMPGLPTSMSMSDLVNHIGHCISEQMTSGNPFFSPEGEGSHSRDILEEMTQYLLSDSQFSSASDEQSLMSRVNSLCCLLQKDAATVQNLQIKNEDATNDEPNFMSKSGSEKGGTVGGDPDDVSGRKQHQSAMSRIDSVGDLLLHLPRIASLPQFLFNISEDGENQAR